MGSSKQISGGEVIQIILLLQQGGLFWMLPVMLIHTTGTAGLVSCIPGLAAGILILLVCTFWRKHCEELTFPQSLEKLLGKPIGKMAGTLFVCLYLLFALVCLGCFIEVLHTQLLPETPRALLLLPVFILAGWLSRNGLEDIARMTPFAVLAYILLIALVFTGAIDSFMPEQLLPLRKNGDFLQPMLYGIFSYSSFLVLLMVYPSIRQSENCFNKMVLAAAGSAAVFFLLTLLALGVFGQQSMGGLVWLPLELARMIQVSSFLERTEALVTVFWIPTVLVTGSLFLWAASESLHQLLDKKKNWWLHWIMVLLTAMICIKLNRLVWLFRLEQFAAPIVAVLLPVLLTLIFAGTVLYLRRKEVDRL